MATDDVKRKLTAIFSADVVGYSRLMGDDELATVQTLTSYKETMTKLIKHYRGRVLDAIGDNLMAEFASVVDAVQCAVEVQQVLSSKNEDLPENRKMFFRIGINLGDVIEEGDRIYGDGVNIAARVESLAEGGGVCISGSAFEQIENKLALGYQYMGEHTVKNIAKPVKVYRVPMGPVTEKEKKIAIRRWHKVAVGALAILIIGIALWALWNYYWRPTRPTIEVASVEKMALPLPDKPSIAVLPFTNLSGDPEQEYLSDGFTEQIITGLSMVPRLFVIARNSVFTYKGKAAKVQRVAEELGVRYVLEGGVQTSGERIRITAQLIDAITGHHLWADRYDRDLKDIFALQDEITIEIMSAIQVKLTRGEIARLRAKDTDNLEAYIKVMQGKEYFYRFNKEGNPKARKLAEEAIVLDPEYADAYCLVGQTHYIDPILGLSKSPQKSLEEATKLLQKAVAIDESHPVASSVLAYVYSRQGQHEKSLAQAERAVALNPGMAPPNTNLCGALFRLGRYEEAIQSGEKAIRLDPKGPWPYFFFLGTAYCFAGRYEDAIATMKKGMARAPASPFPHVNLAAIYNMAGREEEARAEAAEALRLDPNWRKAELEPWIAAMRKAGIPEKPPLPLPDKPSIAVLPFVNMSGDPEQEYISDGISEEIITALSKVPDLFVIARNSSFTYKGKSVLIPKVGRELGVRYVLEGSVRKAGNEVRITAKLVDAKTGNHLWAERYDRDLKDIFVLYDEITLRILSALQLKLTEGQAASYAAKGTKNLDAYLKYIKARARLYGGTPEDYFVARQLSDEAIALDPSFPSPYVTLAWTHIFEALLGYSKSPRKSMGEAFKLAQKVVAMDETSAPAHTLLGDVYLFGRKHEKAISEHERALALDPNSAQAHMHLGRAFTFAGRPEEAIQFLKKAMRLNPVDQKSQTFCLHYLGLSHWVMGQYEEAISAEKRALDLSPKLWAVHLNLAAFYGLLGREEEARAAAAELLRIA
jgi:adenylate cyclase